MTTSATGHPNRHPFTGVLTRVDERSDKAPSGAKGHRVLLTGDAVWQALPSLIGMAIDFCPEWDGHDARRKCGVISHARIYGRELRVRGYVFGRDFPEVIAAREHPLGMSFEMADAHVDNMRADVWVLNHFTFVGAAILLREKAAFTKTSFTLAQPPPLPVRKRSENVIFAVCP